MNNKKYMGALVLSFALLIALPHANATASDLSISTNTEPKTTEDDSIEDLPNYDIASKLEIQSYKEAREISTEDGSNILSDFGNEYQTRLELAKEIKILEKYDYENKDIIKESYQILNSYDLEKIINQTELLKDSIDQIQNKDPENSIGLDENEEVAIDDSIKGFLNDGILITDTLSLIHI